MNWTTLPRSELAPGLAGWRGGDGPDLLLVHGVGMNADYWSNITPTLAEHFRLTVIDLPGHGESKTLPEQSAVLDQYTDALMPLMLPDTRHRVAGHSMGAMIAIDLAIRHSDNIDGIAVLNGVYQRSESARRAVRARAESLSGLANPSPDATLDRWFDDASRNEHGEARRACRRWLDEVDPMAYRTAYGVFAEHNDVGPDDIARIQCPALFMTGSEEPNSTPQMSIAMASLAPNGRHHVIPGARHMMSMTHAENVLEQLLGHLAVTGGDRD